MSDSSIVQFEFSLHSYFGDGDDVFFYHVVPSRKQMVWWMWYLARIVIVARARPPSTEVHLDRGKRFGLRVDALGRLPNNGGMLTPK